LQTTFALAHDVYSLLTSNHPDTVSSYRLPYVEQSVRVDLRNDGQRPSRGVYFSITAQEALRLGYADWNYLRAIAEARAYQRMPLGIVLAQRFAIAALLVYDSSTALDPSSRALGPQEYRLRGGGANSNRGFAPGTLGVGVSGGKRRWEGSLEARVPLGADLGVVLFFDAGDVNQGARVRFKHLNAATGIGFRYFTSFAPIRFDLGWRIPGWQLLGAQTDNSESVDLGVLPSAAHLTIGEAF
jgi:translocation and assembly module TamA